MMPPLQIGPFRDRFFQLTHKWDWKVEGFLDKNEYVHPIDSDTKVISTVFERMASPVIRTIAKDPGYIVETANQTTYPDFTLTHPTTGHRIGLDVKTTYIRRRMILTLGGYNSFLRNNTKNILYPYDSYHEHWILGFIYRQTAPFLEYDLDNLPKRGAIDCPYTVEAIFLRHKHEIAGLRAGSGNTKNIGSIVVSSPDSFRSESGPFTAFTRAKAACDLYWANYEEYQSLISTRNDLRNHPDFEQFNR